jgi:hypothetical protein
LTIFGLVPGVLIGGSLAGLLYYLHRVPTIPAEDWQTFVVPGGSCSIDTPGPLKEYGTLANFGPSTKKYRLWRGDPWAEFILTYEDLGAGPLPAGDLRSRSNGQRGAHLPSAGYRLIGERDVTLGGYPAREMEFELKDGGRLVIRMCLVQLASVRRLYELRVLGKYITGESADVARFFDSFRVLPEKPPPDGIGNTPDNQGGSAGRKAYLVNMEAADIQTARSWPFSREGDFAHSRIFVNGNMMIRSMGLPLEQPETLSSVKYRLDRKFKAFSSRVAVDDATGKVVTPLEFEVLGDGKSLWQSKLIKTTGVVEQCQVDITGVDLLELRVRSRKPQAGADPVWIEPFVEPDARK